MNRDPNAARAVHADRIDRSSAGSITRQLNQLADDQALWQHSHRPALSDEFRARGQTQRVINRRDEIGNGDWKVFGNGSELVAGTDHLPGFHSAAAHRQAEAAASESDLEKVCLGGVDWA